MEKAKRARKAETPKQPSLRLRLRAPHLYPDPEVRISLLTTGRFLSVLPASVLKFFSRRAEVKILPVELPVTGVPNGIVTLKNRTLGPASQRFIQAAREVGRSFVA